MTNSFVLFKVCLIWTDIAVGAPYAKNNTGVIYIFSGDSRGPILSQEINADEIHPELKGFGISISCGTDVDDNGYPGKWFFHIPYLLACFLPFF